MNIHEPMTAPTRILSFRDVSERTRLSRATLYHKIDAKSRWYDPSFPLPVSLGGCGTARRVGFVESEIEQWLQDRIRERKALAGPRLQHGG